MSEKIERTSEVLQKMVVTTDKSTISIDEIFSQLGERSFGILMLFFAIPGAIPSLPSVTSVFAIPIIIFAVQLMLGFQKPYLTTRLLEVTISRQTFNTIIAKSMPVLMTIEKLCKPRYLWLTEKKYEKTYGALILVLGLIFLIPLPFMNWPPAFAICLISLALIERDGILVGIGLFASAVAAAIAIFMIKLIIALCIKFLSFVGL